MGFGARLTEKRKAKGLTQDQLGEGLGTGGKNVGKAVVYGWEKDQHSPRVDQLALMCAKLGASADYLVLGSASSSDLSPEVAALAAAIEQVPKDPAGSQKPGSQEWVLMMVRETVKIANDIAAAERAGNKNDSPNEEVGDSPSSERSKAA